jgi:hypothetical protein
MLIVLCGKRINIEKPLYLDLKKWLVILLQNALIDYVPQIKVALLATPKNIWSGVTTIEL